jgi:hypothetical protein
MRVVMVHLTVAQTGRKSEENGDISAATSLVTSMTSEFRLAQGVSFRKFRRAQGGVWQ